MKAAIVLKKGEESGCVSLVESENFPENPSMEETTIIEEGNLCLSTEQEVQGAAVATSVVLTCV
jgi:hypothetical protein